MAGGSAVGEGHAREVRLGGRPDAVTGPAPEVDNVVAAFAEFPISEVVSEEQADLITRSLMSVGGVRSVRVSFPAGRARVGYDPAQTSLEILRETAARELSADAVDAEHAPEGKQRR